ncbi:MAG: LptF/LptG family permease [Planctomycetota bacterium]
MIKTLHGYIWRDLLRVTLLSLVALTLVMTLFAIIEPLRKQGLSGLQALRLFVYTLPVMLSFTLPVASLFAATIVYGRFSQDRELMACRASGIGTFAVLQPALVLGLGVTVACLGLSNYVAPKLARMGEAAVQRNIQDTLFHKIKTEGHFEYGKFLIHADAVDADHNPPVLYGVVAMDVKDPNDVRLVAASSAFVQFRNRLNETYVSVLLGDAAEFQTGRPGVYQMEEFRLDTPPLPQIFEDEPMFYQWDELLEMWDKPHKYPEVARGLEHIRRHMGFLQALREIRATIHAGEAYTELARDNEQLTIEGPAAWQEGWKRVHIAPRGHRKGRSHVTVRQGGRTVQEARGDRLTVEVVAGELVGQPHLAVRLQGSVMVSHLGQDQPETYRREAWKLGNIPVPASIMEGVEQVQREALFRTPEAVTDDPIVLDRIEQLKEYRVTRVILDIVAELHGRLAYGVSCFLLVALGAALGILLRGGQMISAFTISMIPAAIVIVMVLMGQQMISNPDVGVRAGVLAMWSGVVLLTVANLGLYGHLMRR